MKNIIKKDHFKHNTESLPQYIAEVREQGMYKGEPCIYIVIREVFHSKFRFRAMIPKLIAEWGERLEIKRKVGAKYFKMSQEQAKLV